MTLSPTEKSKLQLEILRSFKCLGSEGSENTRM